jgi:hypothetical protein
MSKKLLKWLGVTLAVIGFLLILNGLKDNLSIGAGHGSMQVGALFFVGGILTHLLNSIAEKLNMVLIHLVDFETTLSMQVPFEPLPDLVTDETPVQKNESLQNSPFSFPIILPDLPLDTKKTPKYLPPEKKSSDKYDYFSDKVMDELPVTETFNPLAEEIKEKAQPVPAKMAVSESLKENNERLNYIARDFPELDAILRRDKEPEPVIEEPPPLPQASIIREGVISNIPFRLFSDGIIEADFVDGRHRFAGIAEFRAYAEGGA